MALWKKSSTATAGDPPPAPNDPPPGPRDTAPLPQSVGTAPARRGSRLWAVALLVVIIVAGAGWVGNQSWFDGFRSPFSERTTDRSQPAVLKSIQDLSRYQAATGTFQLVVDLEKDVKYVPKAILGQRTLFVAAGTVDAYVDFSGVTGDALTVSEDRRTVSLRLPPPGLERPNLDPGRSYVFAQERGVINRFRSLFDDDPNRLQDVYKAAEKKIADAAKDTDLAARAQANTKAMLTGLFTSLGFTTVTVTFTST